MRKRDIEKWLVARHTFVDCRKCVYRKEGCHQDCKFYQGYKKEKANEQREAD